MEVKLSPILPFAPASSLAVAALCHSGFVPNPNKTTLQQDAWIHAFAGSIQTRYAEYASKTGDLHGVLRALGCA